MRLRRRGYPSTADRRLHASQVAYHLLLRQEEDHVYISNSTVDRQHEFCQAVLLFEKILIGSAVFLA